MGEGQGAREPGDRRLGRVVLRGVAPDHHGADGANVPVSRIAGIAAFVQKAYPFRFTPRIASQLSSLAPTSV
jgi:hypothetical protein